MHNFLYSLTICLIYYYPRHVSSINVPIFRRKNCIHTASGIFALCKRLHSTLVESGLNFFFRLLDPWRWRQTILRNVWHHASTDTESHARRPHSSTTLLLEPRITQACRSQNLTAKGLYLLHKGRGTPCGGSGRSIYIKCRIAVVTDL